MLINEITPVGKNRCRVKLETGEEFTFYKGELRLLKLKEGSDLSEADHKKITETILPRRAKLRAMNLLKARNYTERGLYDKLVEGGYSSEIATRAVEYVKSYGYVNDLQYALSYINGRREKYSRKELVLKLRQKGVPATVIDEALAKAERDGLLPGESKFDEVGVIAKNLKKRGFTGNESYEERQKILAYFYRRGFDTDNVFSAMEALRESDDV